MVYYGETQCGSIVKSNGNRCTNNAYYEVEKNGRKSYLCGVHSYSEKNSRKKLPKNPNPNELNEKRYDSAKTVSEINKKNGKMGSVVVSKMPMIKSPPYIEGYFNVYPNYRHQNRKDGYGCARLSPKSLGPVEHKMPNLPTAKNIENYHQFAKFWDFELDENGNVLPEFFQKRIDGYQDDEPHRHKYPKDVIKKYSNNINIPTCSIFYDKESKPHKYDYKECRYFYCHFYEMLAKKEADFVKLKDMIKDGWNLNIVGYDGRDISKKSLMELYNDTSKPFGHELVLYALLIEDNPEKYPWNIFYKENKKIYENVI